MIHLIESVSMVMVVTQLNYL